MTICGSFHATTAAMRTTRKAPAATASISREEKLRARCVDTIKRTLQAPEVLQCVAADLSAESQTATVESDERRERLARTEERIRSLVGFLADGDRSEYVVSALRNLEAEARADRAAIERLTREAQRPLRVPTADELAAGIRRIDDQLKDNSNAARTALARLLGGTTIRVASDPDAPPTASRSAARSSRCPD